MKSIHLVTAVAALLSLTVLFPSCRKDEKTWGVRSEALDAALWERSQWISAANAPVVTTKVTGKDYRAADGASWFVCTLRNPARVKSARWMTAGLGVYQLYVNQKTIGEEVLKPGFTHPLKTKRSFTYDVTDAFRTDRGADNQLAVQVTPGWWADKIATPDRHMGMLGLKCAFRGVLELSYTDGRKEVFGTDCEHWKAGIAGPVKHAGIFDGETYDAREKKGYACPDSLGTPEPNTEFSGEILPSEGAEVYLRKDLAMKPVQAYKYHRSEGATDDAYGKVVIDMDFNPARPMAISAGDTLIVDFGQNAAAVPSFVFLAEQGTELVCLPAEILNDGNGARSRGMDGPEGSVHRTNLRIADRGGMELHYIFAGTGKWERYRPACTFFGYRYIAVTADAPVRFRSIESIPVSSITAAMETGRLTTGNESINQLISNTIWGQRSNYLSVPTDCPQRNERLGWTADTQVFTETGSFFANTDAFFHKWMRDLRDSQSEEGGFPGVAPTAQYGNAFMRVGWADAGVIVPWTIWKQFGDTDIIEESWDAMARFLDHIRESRYDHRRLVAENKDSQWADWVSYEPLETHSRAAFGADNKTPLPEAEEYWNYLSTCYWVSDAGMMADMARATGRDPQPYLEDATLARSILKSRFLNEAGEFKVQILNTMQTPALFALRSGILEGEARDGMIARLRENFAAHGNCLQTGFLGTSILMETLTENGMADIAYELLFQRNNPSWLYSVDNGATTMWERWNSYMKEKGMGPKGMNSFNHYAFGCVCAWIWKTCAGIASDPENPGFRHILMKPVPDRRLGSVKAEYRSAAGLIKSAWSYDGDLWKWNFTIPKGSTASVTLPGESEARTYEAGSYTLTKSL